MKTYKDGGATQPGRSTGSRANIAYAAALAVAITGLAPLPALAEDLPGVGGPPPLVIPPPTGNFLQDWLAMASATQAAQPHWMTPVVTVTPRLEQEVRTDFFSQVQGTGTHITNIGGGKGLEIIPTPDTEVIFGFPPFEEFCPAHTTCLPNFGKSRANDDFGDWNAFLVKYRIAAANEQNGNYIVTAFLQMAVPTGANNISNDLYILQPTLAFGKGWGDFDIQMTVSQQYPVESINPAVNTISSFGDPVLVNTAFQYHYFKYFWPEVELNYTYWPNGIHEGLNQLFVTPGIIFGRFPIPFMGERNNLILGVAYQMAVTKDPVTNNNLVLTGRFTF